MGLVKHLTPDRAGLFNDTGGGLYFLTTGHGLRQTEGLELEDNVEVTWQWSSHFADEETEA